MPACVEGCASGAAVAQLRHPSLIVMAVAVPTLALLGVRHLDHYVERAHANKRWLLAELAAQPICTGQVMPAF